MPISRQSTALVVSMILAVALLTPGCSSSDEEDERARSLDVVLSGVYAGEADRVTGEVGIVTFGGDGRYELAAPDCLSSSCVETGAYRHDAQNETVSLTNDQTGTVRTLTVKALSTLPPKSSLVARSLTEGGRKLVENAASLVKPTVNEALVGGEKVKLIEQQQALLGACQASGGFCVATATAAMCPRGIFISSECGGGRCCQRTLGIGM